MSICTSHTSQRSVIGLVKLLILVKDGWQEMLTLIKSERTTDSENPTWLLSFEICADVLVNETNAVIYGMNG